MKKRFVPNITEDFNLDEDFHALVQNQNNSVRERTVVKGKVVNIDKDAVTVDVGLKNEGRISISEFSLSPNTPLPQIDDMINVYVEKIEGRNGIILSHEKALREESWVILEESYENKKYVDGVIFGRVKGGFTVDLSGVVAFLPGSQVDIRPIKDMTPLMGIVQPFQILKMDKKLGNIVVSRRAILEEQRSEARDEMLSTIKVGMIFEGEVKNIVDFGAFIDLAGKADGLLHITDISWSRVNHPSEVLKIGQKVKVVVTQYNEENKRISLGMRQLEENPWKEALKDIEVKSKMRGKITNINEYGALIEVKPGLEGLVHNSEISWNKNIQNPKKLLNIGQEVDYVVIEIDVNKPKISLSIKQCKPNPWIEFSEKHKVGDTIKAPIKNVTSFGIFVAIGEEIDGIVKDQNNSWGNDEEINKRFTKGDELELTIVMIDIEKERVTLALNEDDNSNSGSDNSAYSGIIKGNNIMCEVTKIEDDGIEVKVSDDLSSFIKKAEISSDKSEQRTDRFSVGERMEAKIISFDKTNKKINLSLRQLESEERKKIAKEYGTTNSGTNLGDKFGEILGNK